MKTGSRDGAHVRVLASHRCGLGLILARYQMQVEFVIGPRLAPRVFLWVARFSSPPQKPTSPNSNLTRIEDPHENQLRLMWLPF